MLEYLDKVFADRAFKARAEHEAINNFAHKKDPIRIRFADVERAFESAFPKELEELREEYYDLQAVLDKAESNAVYRAGWLDGIVVGVLAATQGKNHAQ